MYRITFIMWFDSFYVYRKMYTQIIYVGCTRHTKATRLVVVHVCAAEMFAVIDE